MHGVVRILYSLLIPTALAHMPVFDDDLRNKDITGKSWAVYESMKAGDELLLGLTLEAGENISFSVNMAGSQKFEEYVDYINVTVTGHNAESIDCDPEFDGWRVLSGAHGPGVVDQTKVIPVTTVGEKLHFEPFGVGYYRKLAACQGNVTVADQFNLSVVALRDIQLNVGVGMAEQFSFVDIITMSIWIVQTWWWDNYMVEWSVITGVLILVIISYYRELLRKSFVSFLSVISFVSGTAAENAIVKSALFFNAMHFLLRLIIINLTAYAKKIEWQLAIPIVIHICLPLAVAWYWGRSRHTIYAWGILLIYSSALLWQGFFVLPLYSFIKLLLAFRQIN